MLSLRIDSHIGFRRLSHSGVEPKCTEYLFIVFMSEIKLPCVVLTTASLWSNVCTVWSDIKF